MLQPQSNTLANVADRLKQYAVTPDEKPASLYAQVVALKPAIAIARDNGKSFKNIAQFLKGEGVNIEANTLKTYWSRIAAEGEKTDPEPAGKVEELTAEVEPENSSYQEPEPAPVVEVKPAEESSQVEPADPATPGQMTYLHSLIADTGYRGEIPQGKDAVSRLIDQLKEEKARATRTFTSAAVGSSLNPDWRK